VPIASIAEIVISETAQTLMVRPYSQMHLRRREAHEETGDDRRDQHAGAGERQIGEPEHRAFRRRLRRTTGGTLLIMLCRSGTG
jgi:hypothetical protein